MEEISNKGRLPWVDVAKGILIILVVLSHFSPMSKNMGINHAGVKDISCLNFFYTSFYMAAFFVLSGFTTNFNKRFSIFFISSFKSLVIPLCCFSIIYSILLSLLFKDTTYIKDIFGFEFWYSGFKFYWFLNALFFSRVFYWILNRYMKSDIIKGIFLIAVMLLGLYLSTKSYASKYSDPLYYQEFLRSIFFLWIGQMYKKNEPIYDKYLLWFGGSFVITSLAFKILGIMIPKATSSINFDFNIWGIITHLFFTLFGSALIIYVSKRIRTNAFLELWGKGSIVVYLCHFAIIKILYYSCNPILNYSVSRVWGVFFSLGVACITYFSLFYVIKLFTQTKLKYLLGRF